MWMCSDCWIHLSLEAYSATEVVCRAPSASLECLNTRTGVFPVKTAYVLQLELPAVGGCRVRYHPCVDTHTADYWKSQGRKFCDFCKCWIADNKPSIEFHEGGKKHKENVGKRLKEIHKNSTKQAKQTRKFEDDLKKMEKAAMLAYKKDVESNNGDITAEQIMRDKLNRTEKKIEPEENPNQMPPAMPETNPRFNPYRRERDRADVDPCNTYAHVKRNSHQRGGPSGPTTSGDNKAKGKGGRDKKKGKKTQEEDLPSQPRVQKLWYEARCPQGTYYWHIETNQSVWEPPEEGFLTVEEQEEEAKEQAIQAEFLEQIEKEQAKEKALVLEEQRANAEREKLRELRKRKGERRKKDETSEDIEVQQSRRDPEDEEKEVSDEETKKIPYRRDYSVPENPHPLGAWQTVRVIHKKPVDLQLPKKKETLLVPTLQNAEIPPSNRVFVEKTVTKLSTGGSDDDTTPTTFKKRKFGVKNVRKRFDDD